MEKLIRFLRDEYPEDALEIQECIELLNQAIVGCVGSLKIASNDAVDQRDFEKLAEIPLLLGTIDKIQNQLEGYSDALQLDTEVEDKIVEENILDDEKLVPDYESLKVDSNIPYTLYDGYTYKRPSGFEILGQRYNAKEWKDVLIQTCEFLVVKDKSIFESFVSDTAMQGRKVAYFCKDPQDIRAPRNISGTDIYVMTNMSANQIRNVIEKMLRRYRIKITEFKIFLRADYTARH